MCDRVNEIHFVFNLQIFRSTCLIEKTLPTLYQLYRETMFKIVLFLEVKYLIFSYICYPIFLGNNAGHSQYDS